MGRLFCAWYKRIQDSSHLRWVLTSKGLLGIRCVSRFYLALKSYLQFFLRALFSIQSISAIFQELSKSDRTENENTSKKSWFWSGLHPTDLCEFSFKNQLFSEENEGEMMSLLLSCSFITSVNPSALIMIVIPKSTF